MKGVSFLLISLIVIFRSAFSQCPWQKDVEELQTSCICAYNLGRELSVQCDQVNFLLLLNALNKFATQQPIDLIYINNSTVGELTDNIFANLSVHNVQMSSCKIRKITNDAFKGQENALKNLNLQDNLLTEVPINAINALSLLNLLDLSKNRITIIPNDAFIGLTKLSTLKLNDNNVTLSPNAFRGLEQSLKNLNLKGTRQRRVPDSIRGLKGLAFLDLSLNGIKELPGPGGIRIFDGLDSLTALNLERNLIQSLGETAFAGVRKTLSSLSLLNNLLSEFPVGAVHSLKELRVLDIGFNLLTTLPETAFRGNPSITLLALDGNPLTTVPEKGFLHLNSTLRGLSLGGRSLHCDCKLKWVAKWIRNVDLQVTSRERNPQFCGSPNRFRDRGFYSIEPEEFTCTDPTPVELPLPAQRPTIASEPIKPNTISAGNHTSPLEPVNNSDTRNTSLTNLPPITETRPPVTKIAPTVGKPTINTPTVPTTTKSIEATASTIAGAPSTSSTHQVNNSRTLLNSSATIGSTAVATSSNVKHLPGWRQGTSAPSFDTGASNKQQRPPLVIGFPPARGNRVDDAIEVEVTNAFRQDNSVIIHWDSNVVNILGFRVVYRLFGEKSFKQGPPLEATEREFKIKNVPAQECIIVCVISLEELHVTPETVPYQQCREVRTESSQTSNMDKITIAASAGICGTIIVAVIVFIAASRRSQKLQTTQQKSALPIARLPVNCCGPASSPGPLGSIATLSAFNNKEWDQVSAYSGRSIPRPRIYSTDNQDDMRSHISGMPVKVGKPRYSTAGSTHTLNNYCDTSDNWTDHDMEIYMARNPTTRNGLVPL
ncbi:uncharacterized protein LOC119686996 isoform X2 [Teleopsis dalmanni]|uniref:uncharacterized protein LOC119686996 isoform X2 n=1 Tax=Teleopsis dalmanni TaxID=139649 RepID=UPI0018CE2B8A|nr:uncharacterized protein LOC119686996 isoform X2 [Teleopsis dalmanni]